MNATKFLVISVIGISVTFLCCKREIDSKAKDQLVLEVVDTVAIKYDGPSLILSDSRNDKLLFFDFFNKDVLLTDKRGAILSQFNGTVLGENHFGDKVFGVCFQDDTTICVLSDLGYFLYSPTGRFRNKYRHPFDMSTGVYMTGDFLIRYDAKRRNFISLLKTGSMARVDQAEFYPEIKHLTFFNPDSGSYKSAIKYEHGSPYLSSDYFFTAYGAYFDVAKDSINIVYPYDNRVYVYGLSDLMLDGSFETEPEFSRHEIDFKFGTKLDPVSRISAFANSSYNKIVTSGDTIITSYSGGIPFEQFAGIQNIDQYNQMAKEQLIYYLQVFVKGSSVAGDLALPKDFPILSLYSGGRIYLSALGNSLENDGYKRYLVCNVKITSMR